MAHVFRPFGIDAYRQHHEGTNVPRPSTTPIRRRNGKLQSCEPCRKRKLSCDHRMPACGRCVRRNAAGNCYYHPAPLTKTLEDAVLTAPPSTLTTLSPAKHAQKRVPDQTGVQQPSNNAPAQASASSDLRQPGILSVPSAGILMETTAMPTRVGFLGESSSSAVVAELHTSLGIHPPTDEPNAPRRSCLTEIQARNGAEVLSFFQDIDKAGQLIGRALTTVDSYLMFSPIYQIWYDGLVDFMVKRREAILSRNLANVSLTVWRNTQKRLTTTSQTTAREWALQATDDNIRWETLGMLLAAIGKTVASLPTWDSMFRGLGEGYDRQTLLDSTRHLTALCVELSKQCGSRSDLLPCLLYEIVDLTAITQGDTSIECWTSFGDLCDTVTLQGLHLEQRLDAKTPFFLCELRLRLFNTVFSMDKFLAIFLGRPPKISYRYSVVQDPHDLSDEELCLNEPELQLALSKLQNGWTTEGAPNRATWRKAWTKRHELREDILEIVIGPHTHNIDAQLENVRKREQEVQDSMPPFLRVSPEELIDRVKRDPSYLMPGRNVPWRPIDVHNLVSIHGNVRHAEFLLERAVVNKLKTDSRRLIKAARSSMGLCLKALTLKDYLSELHRDQSDMLGFYAVPPAGVLAMEILKRDQMNIPDDADFPRSEIIQQLSVLASALESVPRDEGNYHACAMGLNAIRKVLDRLLSKPRSAPPPQAMDMFDTANFGANILNDADFLQYLGSVDFDATSWLDPSPAGYYSESSDILMHSDTI